MKTFVPRHDCRLGLAIVVVGLVAATSCTTHPQGEFAERHAAIEAGEEDRTVLRRRYLAAHPSAEVFVDFKDFSFFRIKPSGAHLVAGFGRIIDLRPEQFLTEIDDAASLLEAEAGAVEHMNEDHREAMNLYATKLLGAESADWRCTGCDPEGLDMQAGTVTLRLEFPARVTSAGDLRKMLVRLAEEARAKA